MNLTQNPNKSNEKYFSLRGCPQFGSKCLCAWAFRGWPHFGNKCLYAWTQVKISDPLLAPEKPDEEKVRKDELPGNHARLYHAMMCCIMLISIVICCVILRVTLGPARYYKHAQHALQTYVSKGTSMEESSMAVSAQCFKHAAIPWPQISRTTRQQLPATVNTWLHFTRLTRMREHQQVSSNTLRKPKT